MSISHIFCNFAFDMAFPFQIDILNILVKGIIIGALASAPMGPVGILCVQRTLNKGRWYGFVTGIGASVSDIIYAMITGFGMSFVMDLITEPQTLFYLKVFGSLLLMGFGIYCWRTDPTKKMHISGNKKGSIIHNGVTAFLVTFSNPLIVFLFMALFAQFTFVIPDHPFEMFLGYLSVVAGALIWWYGLTWLIDKIREKFDNEGILIINKVIGSIVIVLSIVILIGTIFNLYTFY